MSDTDAPPPPHESHPQAESPPPVPVAPQPDAPHIEVGAADDDLRYWLAKEAMRQGETRLTAQNGVRVALEARATALTGWAAVGFLALAGASANASSPAALLGAGSAALMLFSAGIIGIVAARPVDWSLVGYDPEHVLQLRTRFPTELEVLEFLGGGLDSGIVLNAARLHRMRVLLRSTGWLLVFAPLAGAAVYLLATTILPRLT